MDGINVIDLKKNELATFPIYRATGSNTVNGLIVRPDLTKLMWLETYGTDTIMMESDQNGKRSSPLFNISRTIYTDLYYDPYGNRYLLVMPQTQATKISGMIIIDFNEKTILKSINFEINFSRQKNWQTKNVRIRDDWLYFFVKQSQYIGHIYRCSISSQNYTHGMNDSISIIIDNIHLTSCIVVTGDNSRSPFILYDPMIRKETNWKKHCNENVCVRQDIDFCIPINQTHSQCTNGEVFEINKNHNEMLIYKIIISVLASIIILILIIYFLFFSKQRARFYQIRLKKLNRVESSKLQMKTPATNEIAE
nr:uncharacterized protein LOC113798013 [Dermatophagoides pteronyssinus]